MSAILFATPGLGPPEIGACVFLVVFIVVATTGAILQAVENDRRSHIPQSGPRLQQLETLLVQKRREVAALEDQIENLRRTVTPQ